MYPFVKVFYRTIEHGSQTQIMLALEPEVEKVTGKYFGNCEEKEASAKGRDVDMRQWLWKQSEVLTKLNEKL